MNDFIKLYENANTLPSKASLINKYTFLIANNIIKAKYMSVSDILSNNSKLNSYIVDKKHVLLIPNFISGNIVSMFVRGVNDSKFPLKLGDTHLPYGLDSFNKDFKYGDPIILVEGLGDYGGLKLLDPTLNIIVMFSNTLPKSSYDIIGRLTNKFIVITDNDDAGLLGFRILKKSLNKYNATVTRVENFGDMKDPGEIAEMTLKYMKTKDQFTKNQLGIIKEYYLSSIKHGGT